MKRTVFEGSHLLMSKRLQCFYWFARDVTNYNTMAAELLDEGCRMSDTTIRQWLFYCREVCFAWLDERMKDEFQIGGEGVVVEIDEVKIGKRKYNKGERS